MTETLVQSPEAPAIPLSAREITPAWIAAALAAGGVRGCRIERIAIERIGEGVGMMSDLHRVTLTHGAGGATGPSSVVVKLHAERPEPRDVSAAYGLYEREARFYQDVAGTISLRSPRCWFAASGDAGRAVVLVLEDLSDAESPDQIEGISLERLTAAIDGVAALHARWWADPRLAELRPIMPAPNEPPYASVPVYYRAMLPAALEGLEAFGFNDLARVATKLADRLAGLMDAFAAEPVTLCHGDYRVDNLMFRATPSGPELTALDWQILMQARGPYDVGYLMGGAVPVELRRAEEMSLLRHYHERLIAGGVAGYSFAACLLDYRRAVLVGVNYWVQSYPASDKTNPRAQALYRSWAERLTAAVADLDLEPLLS